jgi:arabinofuranosyltransferase
VPQLAGSEDTGTGKGNDGAKWRLTLPVAVWSTVALAFVVRCRAWTVDDFYITYRYARNLAHGTGFVYNPGERVFGVTDAGLGLILGLLHAVTRIPVEWIASFLFAGALVSAAALLLAEAIPAGRTVEVIIGASAVVVCSYFWSQQGAAAALVLLLLLLAARGRTGDSWRSGALAGMAVWVRPDAALGAAALAAIVLFERRRIPWRYVAAASLAVALGLGLARWYFGSFLPGTLGAKTTMAQAWPSSGKVAGAGFWPAAFLPLSRSLGAAWPLTVAFGIVGQWLVFRHGGRGAKLLVLNGLGLAVAYPLLGVPAFSWYMMPCLVSVLIGAGFFPVAVGAAAVSRLRSPRLRRLAFTAVTALLLAYPATSLARQSALFVANFGPQGHLEVYRRAAEWLAENAAPTDRVAFLEIGVLGYYSRRPIDDLMGLVSPGMVPFVERHQLADAVRTCHSAFVITHSRRGLEDLRRAGWFRRRYREVARFQQTIGRKGILRVFKLRQRKLQANTSP